MKYRNTETGVILEPCAPDAADALSKDPMYVAMENPPVKPPATRSKKGSL